MLLYFFYVAVVDFFNFFNMFFFSLLQSQIRDVVTRPPGCCNSRIYMFFLLLQLSIRDVATCPRGCCNCRFPMCGVPPRTPRQWRRIAVSSSPAPDMHAGTHRGGGAALLLQGAGCSFCFLQGCGYVLGRRVSDESCPNGHPSASTIHSTFEQEAAGKACIGLRA